MPDPLTDVDRRILANLETTHGEGGVLGADLAHLVGVQAKGIGSRLSALQKRGLVRSYVPENAYRMKAWEITPAGIQCGPWAGDD